MLRRIQNREAQVCQRSRKLDVGEEKPGTAGVVEELEQVALKESNPPTNLREVAEEDNFSGKRGLAVHKRR